jgi:acetylornithine deacetylase/succinyl-diaminopimelate desuccinylase-like protein
MAEHGVKVERLYNRPMPSAHPLLDSLSWPEVFDEATELFRDLLRIDTTNSPEHPGNEIVAARYLEQLFGEAGLSSEVLESAPGRGNIITRIKGDGTGGPPILLSAHLDVVPAEEQHWDHPPFGAEIHDGCIWGRGAIDMKNMAAMEAMAMLLLARGGCTLKRDLIFAGVADEEEGCEFGSLWLVREHPELVRAEYAISEIGGFSLHVGEQCYYPVQVAEKGFVRLTVRATGTPGHGSLPNADNPITHIARAAQRLADQRLPHHRTDTVADFIEGLAGSQPFPNSAILRALLRPATADFILDHLLPDPNFAASIDALLHNTANPTILRAGLKINQVPSEAILRIDGRTLPGQSADDIVREVKAVIGPEFEVTIDQAAEPTLTDPDAPIARRIEEVMERQAPGGIVLPMLIPGFTDAKAYSQLGTRCWGFSPIQMGPEMSFSSMFHGHNERIPVDGFHFGVRTLFDLVTTLVL